MFALLGLILGVGLTSWGHSPPLTFDRFEITLPDQPEGAAPLRGRLIVFLVEDRGHFARAEPLDGPFLRKPQPIVSIAVEARGDDGTIVLGDGVVFRCPSSSGTGTVDADYYEEMPFPYFNRVICHSPMNEWWSRTWAHFGKLCRSVQVLNAFQCDLVCTTSVLNK